MYASFQLTPPGNSPWNSNTVCFAEASVTAPVFAQSHQLFYPKANKLPRYTHFLETRTRKDLAQAFFRNPKRNDLFQAFPRNRKRQRFVTITSSKPESTTICYKHFLETRHVSRPTLSHNRGGNVVSARFDLFFGLCFKNPCVFYFF